MGGGWTPLFAFIPAAIDLVPTRASLGEIVVGLRKIWGVRESDGPLVQHLHKARTVHEEEAVLLD